MGGAGALTYRNWVQTPVIHLRGLCVLETLKAPAHRSEPALDPSLMTLRILKPILLATGAYFALILAMNAYSRRQPPPESTTQAETSHESLHEKKSDFGP